MEKDILVFLFQFYERGDYTHKSIFDALDKMPTEWNNQDSINDLKDRIARINREGLIEGNWSHDYWRQWGLIENGKTFNYRESHALNARLTEKGAIRIEKILEKERQDKVDKSIIETNHTVQEVNKATKKLYEDVLPKNFESQNSHEWRTLVLGLLSGVFIALTFFQQCNSKTDKNLKAMQKTLQETQNKIEQLNTSVQSVTDAIRQHPDSIRVKILKK